MAGRAFDKALAALSGAGGVAHLAFLSFFGWRFFAGGAVSRLVSGPCAVAAMIGIALAFVGHALIKHGGRTKARMLGAWAVAASTALAAVLLTIASMIS